MDPSILTELQTLNTSIQYLMFALAACFGAIIALIITVAWCSNMKG